MPDEVLCLLLAVQAAGEPGESTVLPEATVPAAQQWLVVGKQLPAVRQHLETTEGEACRWMWGRDHRCHYTDG